MKKVILFLGIVLLMPSFVLAQTCPFGEIDCEYPGSCGRYIDQNNNGVCDASETETTVKITQVSDEDLHDLVTGQEVKNYTVSSLAKLYGIDAVNFAQELADYYQVTVRATNSFQYLHDNYGFEPNVVKNLAVVMSSGDVDLTVKNSQNQKKNERQKYIFMPVVIVLLLMYFVMHYMSKSGKLNIVLHRKIWNIILTMAFLICGLLGILLVLRVNYGWTVALPFNILYWHVESGIAMAIISFFHIHWHWPYFKNILKVK